MMLTAAFRPLGALIERIPMPIAVGHAGRRDLPLRRRRLRRDAAASPLLVLPLLAVFLVARLINPFLGVIAALVAGIAISFAAARRLAGRRRLALTGLEFVTPRFDIAAMLGIGVPLYLVTMAAQNLPGFAVLRAAGYQPADARRPCSSPG